MYHERQSRQYCLVHALNALLQKKKWTASSLDEICYSLNDSRWFNPHRSWLGLGNYDVNVLMAALSMSELQMMWFDARQPVERINLDTVHAIVFNVPSRSLIPLWNGRHWYTVLKGEDNCFYNLDSKLSKPEMIENILDYTKTMLSASADNVQVILVTKGSSDDLLLPSSPSK